MSFLHRLYEIAFATDTEVCNNCGSWVRDYEDYDYGGYVDFICQKCKRKLLEEKE